MLYTLTLLKMGYDFSKCPEDIQKALGQVLKFGDSNHQSVLLDKELIVSIYNSQPYDKRVADLMEIIENSDETITNDGFNTEFAKHEADELYISDNVNFTDLKNYNLLEVVFDRKKYNMVQSHEWLQTHGYPSRLPNINEETIEYTFNDENPTFKAKIGRGIVAYLTEKTNGN